MSAEQDRNAATETALAGFAVLDDRGRISLPRPLRHSFGLRAGSSVAYIALGDMILLVPQDAHLAALTDRAVQVLEDNGITVDDFLANLQAARSDVATEAYGEAFLRRLEQRYGTSDTDERGS